MTRTIHALGNIVNAQKRLTAEQAEQILQLAKPIFDNAVAKQFKTGHGVVPVDDYINNLVGEIAELWEAYRCQKLSSACDKEAFIKEEGEDRRLTCAEEEMADIVIRACDQLWDLAGDGYDALEFGDWLYLKGVPDDLGCSAFIKEATRRAIQIDDHESTAHRESMLFSIIWLCCLHAAEFDVPDLLAAAKAKHQFNTNRPIRHGGKIA